MIRWISNALLGLLFTLCVALPARAAVDSATAESLMRDSGLWEQLGALKASVRQGFLEAATRGGSGAASAQEQAAISAVIDSAYEAGRLRAAAQAIFERDLEPGQVAPLQAWLRSPLGRYFTQLEERAAAAGDDPDAGLRKGMAGFSGATPERQQLLQQLVAETQAVEAMTSMTLQTAIGVQRGVLRALPQRPGPSLPELRAQVEQQREAMLKVFAPVAVALFANVYAEASDAQLQDYLAFASTPAARRFTTLGISAIEQAMRLAAEALGQDLVNVRPGAST